jgi:hypothetical protein
MIRIEKASGKALLEASPIMKAPPPGAWAGVAPAGTGGATAAAPTAAARDKWQEAVDCWESPPTSAATASATASAASGRGRRLPWEEDLNPAASPNPTGPNPAAPGGNAPGGNVDEPSAFLVQNAREMDPAFHASPEPRGTPTPALLHAAPVLHDLRVEVDTNPALTRVTVLGTPVVNLRLTSGTRPGPGPKAPFAKKRRVE